MPASKSSGSLRRSETSLFHVVIPSVARDLLLGVSGDRRGGASRVVLGSSVGAKYKDADHAKTVRGPEREDTRYHTQ